MLKIDMPRLSNSDKILLFTSQGVLKTLVISEKLNDSFMDAMWPEVEKGKPKLWNFK